MFNTAYATTAGSKVLENGTIEKLTSYMIINKDDKSSQVIKSDRGTTSTEMYRLLPGSADIPTFSQPLSVEKADGIKAYVVDIRPFVTMTNLANQEYKVHSPYNYDNVLERMVLQVIWDELGPPRLLSLGVFPMKVFSRWIVNTMSRIHNLDHNVQLIMSVVAAYYYYCLHDSGGEPELSNVVKNQIVGLIRQATGQDMILIKQIIEPLPIIRDVNGLVGAMQQATSSSQLSSLNSVGLFTLMGTTVMASDQRVTAAIALEHPPTFIALISGAINYRGASKSRLGEVIKPLLNGMDVKGFKTSYSGLIKEFKQ